MLTELEKWLLQQAKILHKMGYLAQEGEAREPGDALTIVSAMDTYAGQIESLRKEIQELEKKYDKLWKVAYVKHLVL
jgi:hypothetical protein